MKKAIVGAVNRPIIRIITVIAESLERKAAAMWSITIATITRYSVDFYLTTIAVPLLRNGHQSGEISLFTMPINPVNFASKS